MSTSLRYGPKVDRQRKEFQKKLYDLLHKVYLLGKNGGTEEEFKACVRVLEE